jgi:hypothetical protein
MAESDMGSVSVVVVVVVVVVEPSSDSVFAPPHPTAARTMVSDTSATRVKATSFRMLTFTSSWIPPLRILRCGYECCLFSKAKHHS